MKLQNSWSIGTLISLLCGLIGACLLATAGGWSLGIHHLWAFSFLIFPSLPFRLLLGVAVLVSTLWIFIPISRTTQLSPITHHLSLLWLCLPISVILFWFLREHTLQGDGEYKLQLLATQSLRSDPYVWKEPLDSLVAYSFTEFIRRFGASPAVAETLMSVTAGGVYVAAVLYVADKLSANDTEGQPAQRALYITGLLALGSSQLWFGHIENYSLVTAASFATLALAVGYLKDSVPLWLVGLIGGFSVSFHPQAAFAIPALLFLLKRSQWIRQVIILLLSGLIGPLFTIVAMRWLGAPWPDLANGYAGNHQLFFTPAQGLSPAQLWEAWNNLWLVAPLAPLWLIAGLWAFTQPLLRQDRFFRYFTGVAVGLLVYHFTFRNELPRHQDWDLFAIVGPGFTLWGLYAWSRLSRQQTAKHAGQSIAALTAPLLTFALFFTVAWVGVNHFFTLIRPHADQRAIYQRYQLLDLRTQLASAVITPNTPICADTKGCERVAALKFTMPQNGDKRPVIFAHAPARVEFTLPVPEQESFLWLSPALDPIAWQWGSEGVEFQVSVKQNSKEDVLWSRFLTPAHLVDRGWHEALISLAAYRGQTVTLILATLPGPSNNNRGDRAGWGMPWLMLGTPDTRFD